MDITPTRRLPRVRRRPRFKGPSFNQVIPNLVTLLGLCAGLNGIHDALDQRWGRAAVFVLAAEPVEPADPPLTPAPKPKPVVLLELRGPAADALSALFRARATGVAPLFKRLVVLASAEGEAAVEAELAEDVVSAARFRLAP